MTNETVVKLYDQTAHDLIKAYLNKKRNVNTRAEYYSYIERFFYTVHKKTLNQLTIPDLILRQSIVENYQAYLLDNNLSKASVQKAISAVRGLYKYLAANDYDVKVEWFEALESIPDDGEEYAAFTYEQMIQAKEVVSNYYKHDSKEKGDVKAVMIETAFVTSFRLRELMKLKKSSFQLVDGRTWTVTVVGKRNKRNTTAISTELYESIIHIANKYSEQIESQDGCIFKFNEKTIGKMMALIRKELGLEGIEGERYVFHSFKSGGINEVGRLTGGNIKEMQEQGNHSDPKTTFKHYAKLKRNFHNAPSLRIGKKISVIPQLEKMTKEEILELLSKASLSVHIELENLLK